MQILAMLKKEIKVLFRNRLLIFSNIFFPILVIAVNLLYTSTATVEITIGIWGDGNTEKEVEALMNSYNEEVEVSFIRYDNREKALEEYHKKVPIVWFERTVMGALMFIMTVRRRSRRSHISIL